MQIVRMAKGDIMPKAISDYEREQVKQSIIKHTHQLILERQGIKNITVDDIIHSAKMGKSTFYAIYKSKEACFVDVLENQLMDAIRKADALVKEDIPNKEKVTRFFYEVYLAKDSIISFINPTVVEVVFRKLPQEYSDKKQQLLGGSVINYAIQEFRYDEVQAEAFNVLFYCIDQVVMDGLITERAREKALNYLVQMMVSFIEENTINKMYRQLRK